MNKFLVNILLICLFSCTNQSSDFFIGKWQILSVVENDRLLNLENNWIHLKDNGKFDSYDGASNISESGSWEFEPKSKVLFINSNTNEQSDSKWILLMRNDTLIFSSNEHNLYLKAITLK